MNEDVRRALASVKPDDPTMFAEKAKVVARRLSAGGWQVTEADVLGEWAPRESESEVYQRNKERGMPSDLAFDAAVAGQRRVNPMSKGEYEFVRADMEQNPVPQHPKVELMRSLAHASRRFGVAGGEKVRQQGQRLSDFAHLGGKLARTLGIPFVGEAADAIGTAGQTLERQGEATSAVSGYAADMFDISGAVARGEAEFGATAEAVADGYAFAAKQMLTSIPRALRGGEEYQVRPDDQLAIPAGATPEAQKLYEEAYQLGMTGASGTTSALGVAANIVGAAFGAPKVGSVAGAGIAILPPTAAVFAEEYGKAKRHGMSDTQALLYGGAQAGWEGVMEFIDHRITVSGARGAGSAIRRKKVKEFFANVGRAMAGGGATEGATTIAQSGTEGAVLDGDLGKGISKGIAEAPRSIAHGAALSGVVSTLGGAAAAVLKQAEDPGLSKEEHDEVMKRLDDLMGGRLGDVVSHIKQEIEEKAGEVAEGGQGMTEEELDNAIITELTKHFQSQMDARVEAATRDEFAVSTARKIQAAWEKAGGIGIAPAVYEEKLERLIHGPLPAHGPLMESPPGVIDADAKPSDRQNIVVPRWRGPRRLEDEVDPDFIPPDDGEGGGTAGGAAGGGGAGGGGAGGGGGVFQNRQLAAPPEDGDGPSVPSFEQSERDAQAERDAEADWEAVDDFAEGEGAYWADMNEDAFDAYDEPAAPATGEARLDAALDALGGDEHYDGFDMDRTIEEEEAEDFAFSTMFGHGSMSLDDRKAEALRRIREASDSALAEAMAEQNPTLRVRKVMRVLKDQLFLDRRGNADDTRSVIVDHMMIRLANAIRTSAAERGLEEHNMPRKPMVDLYVNPFQKKGKWNWQSNAHRQNQRDLTKDILVMEAQLGRPLDQQELTSVMLNRMLSLDSGWTGKPREKQVSRWRKPGRRSVSRIRRFRRGTVAVGAGARSVPSFHDLATSAAKLFGVQVLKSPETGKSVAAGVGDVPDVFDRVTAALEAAVRHEPDTNRRFLTKLDAHQRPLRGAIALMESMIRGELVEEARWFTTLQPGEANFDREASRLILTGILTDRELTAAYAPSLVSAFEQQLSMGDSKEAKQTRANFIDFQTKLHKWHNSPRETVGATNTESSGLGGFGKFLQRRFGPTWRTKGGVWANLFGSQGKYEYMADIVDGPLAREVVHLAHDNQQSWGFAESILNSGQYPIGFYETGPEKGATQWVPGVTLGDFFDVAKKHNENVSRAARMLELALDPNTNIDRTSQNISEYIGFYEALRRDLRIFHEFMGVRTDRPLDLFSNEAQLAMSSYDGTPMRHFDNPFQNLMAEYIANIRLAYVTKLRTGILDSVFASDHNSGTLVTTTPVIGPAQVAEGAVLRGSPAVVQQWATKVSADFVDHAQKSGYRIGVKPGSTHLLLFRSGTRGVVELPNAADVIRRQIFEGGNPLGVLNTAAPFQNPHGTPGSVMVPYTDENNRTQLAELKHPDIVRAVMRMNAYRPSTLVGQGAARVRRTRQNLISNSPLFWPFAMMRDTFTTPLMATTWKSLPVLSTVGGWFAQTADVAFKQARKQVAAIDAIDYKQDKLGLKTAAQILLDRERQRLEEKPEAVRSRIITYLIESGRFREAFIRDVRNATMGSLRIGYESDKGPEIIVRALAAEKGGKLAEKPDLDPAAPWFEKVWPRAVYAKDLAADKTRPARGAIGKALKGFKDAIREATELSTRIGVGLSEKKALLRNVISDEDPKRLRIPQIEHRMRRAGIPLDERVPSYRLAHREAVRLAAAKGLNFGQRQEAVSVQVAGTYMEYVRPALNGAYNEVERARRIIREGAAGLPAVSQLDASHTDAILRPAGGTLTKLGVLSTVMGGLFTSYRAWVAADPEREREYMRTPVEQRYRKLEGSIRLLVEHALADKVPGTDPALEEKVKEIALARWLARRRADLSPAEISQVVTHGQMPQGASDRMRMFEQEYAEELAAARGDMYLPPYETMTDEQKAAFDFTIGVPFGVARLMGIYHIIAYDNLVAGGFFDTEVGTAGYDAARSRSEAVETLWMLGAAFQDETLPFISHNWMSSAYYLLAEEEIAYTGAPVVRAADQSLYDSQQVRATAPWVEKLTEVWNRTVRRIDALSVSPKRVDAAIQWAVPLWKPIADAFADSVLQITPDWPESYGENPFEEGVSQTGFWRGMGEASRMFDKQGNAYIGHWLDRMTEGENARDAAKYLVSYKKGKVLVDRKSTDDDIRVLSNKQVAEALVWSNVFQTHSNPFMRGGKFGTAAGGLDWVTLKSTIERQMKNIDWENETSFLRSTQLTAEQKLTRLGEEVKKLNSATRRYLRAIETIVDPSIEEVTAIVAEHRHDDAALKQALKEWVPPQTQRP